MAVNHLKEVMGDIISLNQALFIPRRQSVHNIVICQEIIHEGKKRWYGGDVRFGESL